MIPIINNDGNGRTLKTDITTSSEINEWLDHHPGIRIVRIFEGNFKEFLTEKNIITGCEILIYYFEE